MVEHEMDRYQAYAVLAGEIEQTEDDWRPSNRQRGRLQQIFLRHGDVLMSSEINRHEHKAWSPHFKLLVASHLRELR